MDQHLKKTFQILEEKAATRCDICHQADLFDPMTGICQRCEPIATVALAQLAEEQAENFHPEPTPVQTPTPVVTSPLATYHPTLSARDRWLILREAFGLYRDHLQVFLSIVLRFEAPLAAIFLALALFPDKTHLPLVAILSVIVSFLLPNEAREGSLICAIFDSLPDRVPNAGRAIQFANRRNHQHLWAMWNVKVKQWLGSVVGFLIMGLVGAMLQPVFGPLPLSALAITFGFWFSWLALSHNAFYRQILVLEGRSPEEAQRRSDWLANRNCGWLSLLNQTRWLGMLLIAFMGLSPIPTRVLVSGFLALGGPLALGICATTTPLWFMVLMALKILIGPFLTITETLSYLVLRRRAEGMQFQFQYTKEDDDRLKEFMTQTTRNLPSRD